MYVSACLKKKKKKKKKNTFFSQSKVTITTDAFF